MAKKSGRKPPPKCKAILLCERTIIEEKTGIPSIIGAFDRFFVGSLPSTTGRFSVFLQLIDGLGEYRVTIQIRDLAEGEPIVQSPPRSVQIAKLELSTVIIECPPLEVTHPGAYDLVVLADDQEIDKQQF